MKKITLLLLIMCFLSEFISAQTYPGTPVSNPVRTYTQNDTKGVWVIGNGAPIFSPTAKMSQLYFDYIGQKPYFWNGSAWVDWSAGYIISAANGLTETAGTVKIGGPLIEETTIDLDGNDFIISGTGGFAVDVTGNIQLQTAGTIDLLADGKLQTFTLANMEVYAAQDIAIETDDVINIHAINGGSIIVDNNDFVLTATAGDVQINSPGTTAGVVNGIAYKSDIANSVAVTDYGVNTTTAGVPDDGKVWTYNSTTNEMELVTPMGVDGLVAGTGIAFSGAAPDITISNIMPYDNRVVIVDPPLTYPYRPPFDVLKQDDSIYTISSSFSLQAWANVDTSSGVIYVDINTGSDSDNGTTWSLAKKSIKAALAVSGVRKIVIAKGYYFKQFSWDNTVPNGQNLEIIGDLTQGVGDSIYITKDMRDEAGAFSPTTNYYSATLTNTPTAVYDRSNANAYGDPTKLTLVGSIGAVNTTVNSWFWSAGIIYIRTFDSRAPDADMVYSDNTTPSVRLKNNYTYYLKNLNIQYGSLYCDNLDGSGGLKVYAENIIGLGGGCFFDGTEEYMIFNSIFRGSEGDLINIDPNNGINPKGVEYNITCYNVTVDASGQASSAHNGSTPIRINGNYSNTSGQNIADVNGCYSWLVNCNASSSASAGYLFGTGASQTYAWLDHCTSTNQGTFDIEESTNGNIRIRDFVGDGINSGTLDTFLFQFPSDTIPAHRIEGILGITNDTLYENPSPYLLPTQFGIYKYLSSVTNSLIGLPVGTSGQTLRYDVSGNPVATSHFFNNGTDFGFGTTTMTEFVNTYKATGNVYWLLQAPTSGQEMGIRLLNSSSQNWKMATQNTFLSGALVFTTSNSIGSASNMRLMIARTGEVGINTGVSAIPDRLLHIEGTASSASSLFYNIRRSVITTGTAAAGLGTAQEDEIQNASGTMRVAGEANVLWTDATNASEDADYVLKLIQDGTLAERFRVSSKGKITLNATNTAGGTTGDQTINKPSGTVNIAAAGTSVVVTNNLVSTTSLVIPIFRSNDTTAKSAVIVPGSGLFTVYLNVAATAEVSIGFIVIN